MRILLTNDDGIQAEGIHALWSTLNAVAQVTVVAPDRERSATGHAITVHKPLRLKPYSVSNPGVEAWMLNGTPADCVKIALQSLLPKTPDLIVSGINSGPNLGTDVLYSGTVSAAIEGTLLGVPSIAVSLNAFNSPDFTYAADFIYKSISTFINNELAPNTLLNINVPAQKREDIKGVAITKLGDRMYTNTFEQRKDPHGRIYYWMGGYIAEKQNAPDTDVAAVDNGYVSITPIHFDLTNYRLIESLKTWEFQP